MVSYIIRRLLLMVPTLLGITAVVFFVMAWSPGGVGGPLLDQEGATKAGERSAVRDYYNQRYGLDQPMVVQYVRWLNQISPLGWRQMEDGKYGAFAVKWPDLGYSFSKGRPVLDLYGEALPVTLLLNVITTPIVYGVAILSGIIAARYRGKWFDTTSGVIFLALWSIPTMWAGVMLIGYLANQQYIQWFPTGGLNSTLAMQMTFLPSWTEGTWQRGWLLDRLWHLVLPLTCMIYGGFAVLSKLTRGSVLDQISQDYVRTAKAKGLDDQTLLFHHVFRNSLLPLITAGAGILPGLLGGSIVIESIFSLPGMGKLTLEAITARDRELVLAGVLIGGILGLICLLIADLCYAIADPRVTYE